MTHRYQSTYDGQFMKGYLNKKGSSNFFTRYYKRFLVIDYASATLKIRHGCERTNKEEMLTFRDITSVQANYKDFKPTVELFESNE